ncbi:hypothetical protein LguiA_007677 [Lonicera macranthoides]
MTRTIQNPIEKNHTSGGISSAPYDTSASLNPNNCISSSSSSNGSSSHGINIRFPRIASAIEESIVWDGVYFVRIAECGGYEYEQSYAFLPLLPISISFLSTTAVYLYRLSVIVLKDPEAAPRASILYSESLYALLSIGGLYHLMSGKSNYSTLWLALSGSARSNGVLMLDIFAFRLCTELMMLSLLIRDLM